MQASELETRRTRPAFILLAVGISTYALLQSLVAPALPLLASDLHTGQDTVTWVMTAYLLAAAVFTPILGRVGDASGKVKVLMFVLASQAAGAVLAALAPSIGVVIAARAIQGLGAGIIPLGFGIVRDEFPRERVATTIGFLSSLLAGGSGLGLVAAGPVADAFGYRWLFWIPAILSAIAAAGIRAFVPESAIRSSGRINYAAAVILSAWLVLLIMAVSRAQVWGWVSVQVVGMLVGAAIFCAAWVVVELRAHQPLIDMRMMCLPAVWTTNVAALLVGMIMFGTFTFLPRYIQAPVSTGYGFGASMAMAGLVLLPMQLSMFVLGAATGVLSARFSARLVLVAGAVMEVPGCLIMAVAPASYWLLILATVLLGSGVGLAYSSMSSIVVNAVPVSQTSVATGMNTNIRTIGGSIGTAAMASIVTSRVLPTGLPKIDGYTVSFLALAIVGLLAIIAALSIPRPTSRRAPVPYSALADQTPIATAGTVME